MAAGKIDRPRMRPRFEVDLEVPGERVLARLRRRLGERGGPATGNVQRRHAELRIPHERAHFWSPCLSVCVDRSEAGGERLRGRFAPDPSVWMMFMGIYGVLGMGATLAVMFGISQWIAREPPWALLGAPAALALMAFVYGATFIGQGLGAAEMYELRSFVDDAIDEASDEPSDEPSDEASEGTDDAGRGADDAATGDEADDEASGRDLAGGGDEAASTEGARPRA